MHFLEIVLIWVVDGGSNDIWFRVNGWQKGLVMGVANDRSIAWHIAKAAHEQVLRWLSRSRVRHSRNVSHPGGVRRF